MPYERFNKPSNATLVEDLVEETEEDERIPPRNHRQPQPMTDKFIRHPTRPHAFPTESGMTNRFHPHIEERFGEQQPQIQSVPVYVPQPFGCPEVYQHIANCPVCKRIYKCDRGNSIIYIIIIIVLLGACAMLFKKAYP